MDYKEKFESIVESYPNLGNYLCLCKLIHGKNLSKEKITSLFNDFIPKEDYLRSEKAVLISQLVQYSKTPPKYGLTTTPKMAKVG